MNAPEKRPPGPAWPLFVVAGLSFVPFLGIFFGGAGATWGLVSSRRKAVLAALIAMTGALLNIGGIIALSVSGLRGAGSSSGLWAESAQTSMSRIVIDLENYHDKEHTYPASLHALPGYDSPFRRGKLLDLSGGPFAAQHEFQYTVSADGTSYDLFAEGPDNKPGTADDVRPRIPASRKASNGYRPAGE